MNSTTQKLERQSEPRPGIGPPLLNLSAIVRRIMITSWLFCTKYETLVQADRNSARMAAVVDFVFSRPILTIKQLESGLDMPYMAAKRYVEKLVDAGVLQETTV